MCGDVGRAGEWFLHHTGSQWRESWAIVMERSFQVDDPESETRPWVLPWLSEPVHTVSRGAGWGSTQCATASHHRSWVVWQRAVA